MSEDIRLYPMSYLYRPEGTSAVNPLTRDFNRQEAASVSKDLNVGDKSRPGDILESNKYKDCKT